MDWRRGYHAPEHRLFMEVSFPPLQPRGDSYEFGSWISFAPVAGLTRDFFGLSSTTPVNWLSIVVLFVYCIVSPLTAYIYNHRGVRTGVSLLLAEKSLTLPAYSGSHLYDHWSMA